MAKEEFTHLHVHTHYSLLDGMAKIPQILDKAKESGMNSLAITDHGVMYGAVEFYKEAKKRGIKPIIGCEVYIAPRTIYDKTPKIDTSPHHLVLLCKNEEGYLNLVELVTQANTEGYYYKPRIDKDLLTKHSKGLIALSGCGHGEIGTLILNGNFDRAKETALFYKEIFKEDFYLELQDHPGWEDQAKVNTGLIKLGKELNIPLVVTKDVHYIDKEDAEAHDVLLCLQTGSLVSETNRLKFDGDLSLTSPEEIAKRFKDVPEALKNTLKIAQKCNFDFSLGNIYLPQFELPKGETYKSFFQKKVKEGLKKHYPKLTPEIKTRFNYELKIIEKMGYESYFLVVADFVNWAKEKGIVVGPGRGSAAGSIISYILNITNLDPLKYGLLFERFLNPERIVMPDFDLDFADDKRKLVIEYVVQKYGQDHVAQIITFGTMMARNAIRDTGRVLGFTYSEIDEIAKVTPSNMPLKESIKVIPELKAFYKEEKYKKLLDLASRLEGVARHSSTHAAGLVISQDPLIKYTPLQRATKGDLSVITQYHMGSLEDIGLLKIDILGLANLTILKNASRIVRKVYDQEIDLENISLDDAKTYQLLSKGETTGVFQLESSGMKRYIKELKPTNLEDIIAMVALYRPGPMQWIDDFIQRKHGRAKISYVHPTVERALKNTYGIAVYQEQVMKIAEDMAGFSGSEADTLRKAMGKKIPKLMKEMKKRFIDGAVKNKVPLQIAEKVFLSLEDFAQYAFNKSHAACYALIAYQTAYLKTHFPAAFMAALMTSDYNDIDKIAFEVSECQRLKIKVLPPSVNESFAEFGVVKETLDIRFGLMAIKNVGSGIIHAILTARETGGKFETIENFCRRVSAKEMNRKVLESLIKCGALDDFGAREDLLYNLDKILSFASKTQHLTANGQLSLFDNSGIEMPSLVLTKAPEEIPLEQRLAWEKELLGLYVSQHPIDQFKNELKNKNIVPIAELEHYLPGALAKIVGVITQVQRVLTRSKETMLFVRIEDKTGGVEILVFPKRLKETGSLWQEGKILTVSGRLSSKDGTPKILLEDASTINSHQKKNYSRSINVTIPFGVETEVLKKIKSLFYENRGEDRVFVFIQDEGAIKKIRLPFGVNFTKDLALEISQLLGEQAIEIKTL